MLLDPIMGQKTSGGEFKDAVLGRLANRCNIAQFVSFSPNLAQRYACINGYSLNHRFGSLEDACAALLTAAESHAVNIRSFRPEEAKGQRLIQKLQSVFDIAAAIRERASHGFFTIANELIPVDDGGVSGVAIGDVIEFAPGDTPKCVEKPGVASLPRSEGERLLQAVYGFYPQIDFGHDCRVEFSLHPVRRGIKNEHTIIWELESLPGPRKASIGNWPNRFSEFLGDKTYGLLIAVLLGCDVPKTTAIHRALPPFHFGKPTGTGETWIRTCPRVPVPGKYTTAFGWRDPFELLAEEDPEGLVIPSVLAQESVPFMFSGAAQTMESGVLVEGKAGRGDSFMLGTADRARLSEVAERHVRILHDRLFKRLGSAKFEWVWDGKAVWVVQLHHREKAVSQDVIFPGTPDHYVEFHASSGLEALRGLVSDLRNTKTGVIIVGNVGVTSHLGDVLREAHIPSRLSSASIKDDSTTRKFA
jgi:hypothetical protein